MFLVETEESDGFQIGKHDHKEKEIMLDGSCPLIKDRARCKEGCPCQECATFKDGKHFLARVGERACSVDMNNTCWQELKVPFSKATPCLFAKSCMCSCPSSEDDASWGSHCKEDENCNIELDKMRDDFMEKEITKSLCKEGCPCEFCEDFYKVSEFGHSWLAIPGEEFRKFF